MEEGIQEQEEEQEAIEEQMQKLKEILEREVAETTEEDEGGDDGSEEEKEDQKEETETGNNGENEEVERKESTEDQEEQTDTREREEIEESDRIESSENQEGIFPHLQDDSAQNELQEGEEESFQTLKEESEEAEEGHQSLDELEAVDKEGEVQETLDEAEKENEQEIEANDVQDAQENQFDTLEEDQVPDVSPHMEGEENEEEESDQLEQIDVELFDRQEEWVDNASLENQEEVGDQLQEVIDELIGEKEMLERELRDYFPGDEVWALDQGEELEKFETFETVETTETIEVVESTLNPIQATELETLEREAEDQYVEELDQVFDRLVSEINAEKHEGVLPEDSYDEPLEGVGEHFREVVEELIAEKEMLAQELAGVLPEDVLAFEFKEAEVDAIQHEEENSSNWVEVGSGQITQQVQVDVKEEGEVLEAEVVEVVENIGRPLQEVELKEMEREAEDNYVQELDREFARLVHEIHEGILVKELSYTEGIGGTLSEEDQGTVEQQGLATQREEEGIVTKNAHDSSGGMTQLANLVSELEWEVVQYKYTEIPRNQEAVQTVHLERGLEHSDLHKEATTQDLERLSVASYLDSMGQKEEVQFVDPLIVDGGWEADFSAIPTLSEIETELRQWEQYLEEVTEPHWIEEVHTQIEDQIGDQLQQEEQMLQRSKEEVVQLQHQGPTLPEPPPYDFLAELEAWEEEEAQQALMPQGSLESLEEGKWAQMAGILELASRSSPSRSQAQKTASTTTSETTKEGQNQVDIVTEGKREKIGHKEELQPRTESQITSEASSPPQSGTGIFGALTRVGTGMDTPLKARYPHNYGSLLKRLASRALDDLVYTEWVRKSGTLFTRESLTNAILSQIEKAGGFIPQKHKPKLLKKVKQVIKNTNFRVFDVERGEEVAKMPPLTDAPTTINWIVKQPKNVSGHQLLGLVTETQRRVSLDLFVDVAVSTENNLLRILSDIKPEQLGDSSRIWVGKQGATLTRNMKRGQSQSPKNLVKEVTNALNTLDGAILMPSTETIQWDLRYSNLRDSIEYEGNTNLVDIINNVHNNKSEYASVTLELSKKSTRMKSKGIVFRINKDRKIFTEKIPVSEVIAAATCRPARGNWQKIRYAFSQKGKEKTDVKVVEGWIRTLDPSEINQQRFSMELRKIVFFEWAQKQFQENNYRAVVIDKKTYSNLKDFYNTHPLIDQLRTSLDKPSSLDLPAYTGSQTERLGKTFEELVDERSLIKHGKGGSLYLEWVDTSETALTLKKLQLTERLERMFDHAKSQYVKGNIPSLLIESGYIYPQYGKIMFARAGEVPIAYTIRSLSDTCPDESVDPNALTPVESVRVYWRQEGQGGLIDTLLQVKEAIPTGQLRRELAARALNDAKTKVIELHDNTVKALVDLSQHKIIAREKVGKDIGFEGFFNLLLKKESTNGRYWFYEHGDTQEKSQNARLEMVNEGVIGRANLLWNSMDAKIMVDEEDRGTIQFKGLSKSDYAGFTQIMEMLTMKGRQVFIHMDFENIADGKQGSRIFVHELGETKGITKDGLEKANRFTQFHHRIQIMAKKNHAKSTGTSWGWNITKETVKELKEELTIRKELWREVQVQWKDFNKKLIKALKEGRGRMNERDFSLWLAQNVREYITWKENGDVEQK